MSLSEKMLLDLYWKDRMSQRMFPQYEASRLLTALKGFFLDRTESEKTEFPTLFEWFFSKRPYGNKNIEESIAFQLGWDRDRVLTHTSMPEFVELEARKIHELVQNELRIK